MGNFNARIENNVGGIRVVQSFANERYEEKLFAVDNQNHRTTKLLAYKTMVKRIEPTSEPICYDYARIVSMNTHRDSKSGKSHLYLEMTRSCYSPEDETSSSGETKGQRQYGIKMRKLSQISF